MRKINPPAYKCSITFGFVLICLISWELSSRQKYAPEYFLGPLTITESVFSEIVDGGIFYAMFQSLYRVYLGFFIGGLVGFVSGLFAGVSRTFRNFLDVPQAFFHSIPKIALFPAVAVWLGFTDSARILIIAISCFFPTYLNALNGVYSINPKFLWLSRNLEMSRISTFIQIIVPASLPRALIGLRISLMIAFILMVATEVLGGANGMGAATIEAYHDGDYRKMYALIFMISFMGFVSNYVMQKIIKKLNHEQY